MLLYHTITLNGTDRPTELSFYIQFSRPYQSLEPITPKCINRLIMLFYVFIYFDCPGDALAACATAVPKVSGSIPESH